MNIKKNQIKLSKKRKMNKNKLFILKCSQNAHIKMFGIASAGLYFLLSTQKCHDKWDKKIQEAQ